MLESESEKIVFDEFTFNTKGNLLFSRGAVVPLEPAAARVLRYFLENGDRVVSKNELLEAVWNEVFTTEDVLKRAVSQIRRALGDDAQNPRFIETHHRRGYRFIALRAANSNGESPRSAKSIEKPDTSSGDDPNFDCFVGRRAEIEFLQAEFRRASKGSGQPVLIAGDPGIGKTQLTVRFADWLSNGNNAQSAVSLRLRFFDYEASHLPPLDLFLDLLSEACRIVFPPAGEITNGDAARDSAKLEKSELRRLIEAKFQISLPEEFFAASSERRKVLTDASRAIAPLAECFARLSRVRPLVLIFDDVQWADETSRQIIGYLMRVAADAPLMLINLTRRGDAENPQKNFRQWLEAQAAYRSFTTLSLSPLTADDCRNLIVEIFRNRLDGNEILPADLIKLREATGGNPYFLVETIRLLLNENIIQKNASGWHWRGIGDVPLPETVRLASRSKLVGLSAGAHDLIECAAVLGDAFTIETLELMTQSDVADGKNFESFLDEAIAAQVLTEQNVSGADDCQFYHTTLRRAVYIDLSPRRRRRLHARAAQSIEKSHAGDLERHRAALGAHWENAGDFKASFRLNTQAARAAAARFDWAEAAELLARAERVEAKIADDEKPASGELLGFLSLRGEIYMSVGRRTEADKILNEAVLVGERLPREEREQANVFLNLGRTLILLGKYREAIAPLEKSLALSGAVDDADNSSAALIQLASAKYALCEYEASSEILQKIITQEPTTSYNRAVALGKLGWTRALQSRYREAKNLLEQALEFHRTAGDLRERAVLAMCLNWCEYGTGDYEAAIRSAQTARREAEIVGEPYNESVAMMRVAKSRIAQGLYSEAETLLNEVWEKQKNLDAPHAQAETVWMRGRARLALDNLAEAENDLEKSLAMIRSVGDRDDEFRVLIDQSYLQSHLESYTNARDLADRAAAIAEEIGITEGGGEALTAKAVALIGLKKFGKAVAAASDAVRLLAEFDSGELWRAHHALALALLGSEKTANKKSPASFAEAETHLRRAIEILDSMRNQFSPQDVARRLQLTRSHAAPAKDLRDLLNGRGRRAEAAEVTAAWQLD